jgi:hypothetical protein
VGAGSNEAAGRRVKTAIIAVLVLVGVLVAADFGIAAAAEQQVSKRMRSELGLANDPDVWIDGFPFLTQALAGDYQNVVVTADRLKVGPLTEVSVRAELHHARVGLSELLGSGPRTVRIDEAEGTVRINADDLATQLPGVTDLRVESVDKKSLKDKPADIDPDTAVRLIGTVHVLGQSYDATVLAVTQLDGRVVRIVPRDFEISGVDSMAELPRPMQNALRELFTVRLNPGTLPFTVTPTKLKAVDGALEVSGTAQGLVISGGGTSTSPVGR